MDVRTIDVQHNFTADQWDWPLQHNDDVVKVTNTADTFSVGLDASVFSPKDIEVISNKTFFRNYGFLDQSDQQQSLGRVPSGPSQRRWLCPP